MKFKDQDMHSSITTNLFHPSLEFVATRETQIKQLVLDVFLYPTYSMRLAAISMAAITMCGSKLIQDEQVHNLLANVAKLGGNGFNITGI